MGKGLNQELHIVQVFAPVDAHLTNFKNTETRQAMGVQLSDYLAKRAQAPLRHLLGRICTHSNVGILQTHKKAGGLATPRDIEWYEASHIWDF